MFWYTEKKKEERDIARWSIYELRDEIATLQVQVEEGRKLKEQYEKYEDFPKDLLSTTLLIDFLNNLVATYERCKSNKEYEREFYEFYMRVGIMVERFMEREFERPETVYHPLFPAFYEKELKEKIAAILQLGI